MSKIGSIFISDISNRRKGYLITFSCSRVDFIKKQTYDPIRNIAKEIGFFLEAGIKCTTLHNDMLINTIMSKDEELKYSYGINVYCKGSNLYDYEYQLSTLFKEYYSDFSKREFAYDDKKTAPKFIKMERIQFINNEIIEKQVL